MSFVNILGGTAVRPAYPSYAALTISSNVSLVWPTESLEGVPYVAAELDVIASVGGLSLAMPSALAGATGVATMVTNVGANNLNLTDSAGNLIVTLVPSVSWLISLTNNSTAAGSWRSLQMASTSTTTSASAIADNITTQATVGGKLQVIEGFNRYTANQNITSANRGALNVLGAAAAGATTFTLDTVVNLTAGWYAEFANQHATAVLSIASSGGATFNGVAGPLAINPGTSIRIICDGAGFDTAGAELLTQYAVLVGGGATGTPTALSSLGNSGQVLTSSGMGSAPTWQAASTGGGAIITNPMSANLVLTSASKQVQTVAPNAMGLAIQLPDLTTIASAGANLYELNNITTNGAFPVAIIDSASNFVGWLLPGGRTVVNADSVASATGGWKLFSGNRAQDNGYYEWGASGYIATTALSSAAAVELDSTYGVLLYCQSSATVAAAYKLTDGIPQVGASSAVNAVASTTIVACRLSTTEAFIVFAEGTNGIKCATVDINTSSLVATVNSAAVVDAGTGAPTSISCDSNSAAQAIVGYANGTVTKAVTVSISAGACTVNTPQQLAATSANRISSIVMLSPTLSHYMSTISGSSTQSFIRITLSGSTITGSGSPVTQANRSGGCLIRIDATHSGAVYNDSSTSSAIYANVLTDTGSAITASETQLLNAQISSTINPAITANVVYLDTGAALVYPTVAGAEPMPFYIVKMTTGTPTISCALYSQNVREANRAGGGGEPVVIRTNNNTGMLFVGINGPTEKAQMQPFCWA